MPAPASGGGVKVSTPRVLAPRARAGVFAWKRRAAAVLVGLAYLLALSCDECTSPPDCPPEALGIVQGFVLGGGVPVITNVYLVPVEPEQAENEFGTRADSTGGYSFTVPAGRYLLRLPWNCYYAHDGLVEGSESADTLVIAGPAQRIDLAGGAVRLQIAVPSVLEAWDIRASIGVRSGSRLTGTYSDYTSDSGAVREFHFPFVRAGTYVMQVDLGDGPALWLPPTLNPEYAGTIQVGTAATTTFTTALPEPAWISGEITGSWQQFPHMSPIIVVLNPDSTLLHEVDLYSTPAYRLILPAPTSVKLGVSMSDRVQWIGGDDFSSATLFAPEPGEEITGASLEESGIACILEGPGPIAWHGAEFQLFYPDGRPLPGSFGDYANPAFFSNLRPGTYFLYITRNGWGQPWHPQWYDGADSLAAATPITIAAPGEVVEITAHLREGGRISGRVTRSGEPAGGVWISVRLTDGTLSESHVARTNAGDGAFELVGLSDGGYRVGARNPSNTATYWYPGTYDPASAETILIENHNAVADIEWRIPF